MHASISQYKLSSDDCLIILVYNKLILKILQLFFEIQFFNKQTAEIQK